MKVPRVIYLGPLLPQEPKTPVLRESMTQLLERCARGGDRLAAKMLGIVK